MGSEYRRSKLVYKDTRRYVVVSTILTSKGVRAKFLDCNITPNHVSFGIKGNPPYLSVKFSITILTSFSTIFLHQSNKKTVFGL